MLFMNIDPLAFGMAGIALLISLISLLILVAYVRKLANAAMHLASAFYTFLETQGCFDEQSDEDAEDDEDEEESDDDDESVAASGDNDDPPPHSGGSYYVTSPLSESRPGDDDPLGSVRVHRTVPEDNDADLEEDAALEVIFHRVDRAELALV